MELNKKLQYLNTAISRCSFLEKKLRDTYANVLDLDSRLKQADQYDVTYRNDHRVELEKQRHESVERALKDYDRELDEVTRKMCGDFYDTFMETYNSDSLQ